jgi:hypothetical protein
MSAENAFAAAMKKAFADKLGTKNSSSVDYSSNSNTLFESARSGTSSVITSPIRSRTSSINSNNSNNSFVSATSGRAPVILPAVAPVSSSSASSTSNVGATLQALVKARLAAAPPKPISVSSAASSVAAAPIENAEFNNTLQMLKFDMLRILTYHFVLHKDKILDAATTAVSRTGYPFRYNEDAFYFIFKGGSAVKVWENNLHGDTFPVHDLTGDIDCAFLINPNLLKYGTRYNFLKDFLFKKSLEILSINITELTNTSVRVDIKYYNDFLKSKGITAGMDKSFIFESNLDYFAEKSSIYDFIMPRPPNPSFFTVMGMKDILFRPNSSSGLKSSHTSLIKLILNTGSGLTKELLDISLPHVENELNGIEYNLYSFAWILLERPSWPSKIINSEDNRFIIATPTALLYELSIINLPQFETREEKLAKRRSYISYLKSRNNVRKNVRNNTTRKALRKKSTAYESLMRNAGLNTLTFSEV